MSRGLALYNVVRRTRIGESHKKDEAVSGYSNPGQADIRPLYSVVCIIVHVRVQRYYVSNLAFNRLSS